MSGGDRVSQQSIRKLVALAGAAAVLVIAAWIDTVAMAGIQRRSSQTFDITEIAVALPFGFLTVAGAVLATALLARWARSVLVGAVYALVGAFLAFLFPIVWLWAASVNGATPVMPAPIATFVNDVYLNLEQGPLNAVAIIGAGMSLAGVASIGSALRHRAPTVVEGVETPMQAEVGPN
jgi:hypothetical protein